METIAITLATSLLQSKTRVIKKNNEVIGTERPNEASSVTMTTPHLVVTTIVGEHQVLVHFPSGTSGAYE